MKKRSLFALSLLLGVGALSSCSNDDKDTTDPLNFTPLNSLNATIEGQQANGLRSKLTYDSENNKYTTEFTAGNEIFLTDLAGNTATFVNSEADVKAFSLGSGSVPANTDLYAGYPASAFSVEEGSLIYTAPATQTYKEDAIVDEGTFPMLAKSNTSNFDFKNLDCLLRVNVKTSSESETFSVKSIKLTTKSGALSGTFTADYNSGNPTLTAVEGSSSNAVSLNCGDGVEINNEDKTFYIAIPAGTYDGLQVQVRLSNGYAYIDQPREAKTFERSKFYTASITVGATPTTGVKTCVDLGLPSGILWATCNVGASSPEEYGDYFAWGETTTKEDYSTSTYKWSEDDYSTFTKYTTKGLNTLEAADDAATVNWGSAWRMPTLTEQQELKDNCTFTWKDDYNGKAGYLVTSKAEGNSNSIFLPAAGFRRDSNLGYTGYYGDYWSSSLFENDLSSAYSLAFYYGDILWTDGGRCLGLSVRAVVK